MRTSCGNANGSAVETVIVRSPDGGVESRPAAAAVTARTDLHVQAEHLDVDVLGPGDDTGDHDETTGAPITVPPGRFTVCLTGGTAVLIEGTRTELRDLLDRLQSALDDPALTTEE